MLTSIKSYDLNVSYQKDGAWLTQLKKDTRSLYYFTSGSNLENGVVAVVKQSDYDSKVLNIAIPDVNLSVFKVQELQSAVEYAKGLGITIVTTIVK